MPIANRFSLNGSTPKKEKLTLAEGGQQADDRLSTKPSRVGTVPLTVEQIKAIRNQKVTLAERAQQADNHLSTRYDALNQLFAEAEQHLRSLKPLHPVWISYALEQEDGGPDCWQLLGLTKYQGKWRLCHAWDHERNDDGSVIDLKPIIECPVDVRVQAAEAVRKLHAEIVKSKEEYIPKVDAAIKELTDLTDLFKDL